MRAAVGVVEVDRAVVRRQVAARALGPPPRVGQQPQTAGSLRKLTPTDIGRARTTYLQGERSSLQTTRGGGGGGYSPSVECVV